MEMDLETGRCFSDDERYADLIKKYYGKDGEVDMCQAIKKMLADEVRIRKAYQ